MAKIALLAFLLVVGALGVSSDELTYCERVAHSADPLSLALLPPESPPVSSARDGSVGTRSYYDFLTTVTISTTPGTNDTGFADEVCAQIEAGRPVTTLTITGLLDNSGEPILTLPACVYTLLVGNLSVLTLNNVMVNGTSSNPDPLAFIGPLINPSAVNTEIYLNRVKFYGPNNDSRLAEVNWTAFYAAVGPKFVNLEARNCSFIGSLPARLYGMLISIDTTFSGTIPSTLLPTNYPTMGVTIQNSLITGGLPEGFLANVASYVSLSLNLQFNPYLNGTIPSNFLTGANATLLTGLTFNASFSPVAGAITSDLWGLPTSLLVTGILIDLRHTKISSLPKTFLSSHSFSTANWFYILTDHSAITGDLPSRIMPRYAPYLQVYRFTTSGNILGGTIPASLIGDIASWTGGSSYVTQVLLQLEDCQMTGLITFPAAPPQTLESSAYTTINFFGHGNNFTYANIKPSATRYLVDIDVGHSSGSRGNLDNVFGPSTDASILATVDFSNSSISGTMPDLNTKNDVALVTLDLSYTQIDFCSNTSRSPWNGQSALVSCRLLGTNANLCPQLYPRCDMSELSPSAPTTSPSTSSTCPPSTRPSADFTCDHGIWINLDSTTSPTLTIPSTGISKSNTTSQVIVLGNVTSSTIVFQNLGTQLIIAGCADNLTSIIVHLSEDEYKLLTSLTEGYRQQLLGLQGSNCANNLSTVTLTITTPDPSCTVTSSIESQGGQFSALFSVTANTCTSKKERRVWVIVVPVVCGVVLLGVIITVLLAVFCSEAKDTFRPYAGADPHGV